MPDTKESVFLLIIVSAAIVSVCIIALIYWSYEPYFIVITSSNVDSVLAQKVSDFEVEMCAWYPLGDKEFCIRHPPGIDYFAFFDFLAGNNGSWKYIIWLEDDKVWATAAMILRDIPTKTLNINGETIGKTNQQAWYICDVKVHPEKQGQHFAYRVFRKMFFNSYFSSTSAYGITMLAPASQLTTDRLSGVFVENSHSRVFTENSHSRVFTENSHSRVFTENRSGMAIDTRAIRAFKNSGFDLVDDYLHIYMLAADEFKRLYDSLGNAAMSGYFRSNVGIKDLYLRESAAVQKLDLWHFIPEPNYSTPAIPNTGYIMFTMLSDTILPIKPIATGIILQYNMSDTDWNFVNTAEI
jgi:hypothetical protein